MKSLKPALRGVPAGAPIIFTSMKFLLSVITVIASIFLEWTLGMFRFEANPPPVVAFTLFIWFWDLSLAGRLWLALIIGLLLDGIGIFPFGTHLFLFSAEAFFVELLRVFFSNVRSFFTRGVGIFFMFVFYYVVLPIEVVLLNKLNGLDLSFPYHRYFFYGAIFWTLLFSIVVTAVFSLKSKKYRK